MNILDRHRYTNGDQLFVVMTEAKERFHIVFDSNWNGASPVGGVFKENHTTDHTIVEVIQEVVKGVVASSALKEQALKGERIKVLKGFHQEQGSGQTSFKVWHFTLFHKAVSARHVYQSFSPQKSAYAPPLVTGRDNSGTFISPQKQRVTREELRYALYSQEAEALTIKRGKLSLEIQDKENSLN